MLEGIREGVTVEKVIKFSLPGHRHWPAGPTRAVASTAEGRSWPSWAGVRGGGLADHPRAGARAARQPAVEQLQVYKPSKALWTPTPRVTDGIMRRCHLSFRLCWVWPRDSSHHVTPKNRKFIFQWSCEKIPNQQLYHVK